jgi:hypothetical protein
VFTIRIRLRVRIRLSFRLNVGHISIRFSIHTGVWPGFLGIRLSFRLNVGHISIRVRPGVTGLGLRVGGLLRSSAATHQGRRDEQKTNQHSDHGVAVHVILPRFSALCSIVELRHCLQKLERAMYYYSIKQGSCQGKASE